MFLVSFSLHSPEQNLVQSLHHVLVPFDYRKKMNFPSRIEVRLVIRFHWLKGVKPKQIYNKVTLVYGEVISFLIVAR